MIDVECPEGGRHEFYHHWVYGGGEMAAEYWECAKCELIADDETVTNALNAAMMLTADEAEVVASYIFAEYEHPTWEGTPAHDVYLGVLRYARARRGENDEEQEDT